MKKPETYRVQPLEDSPVKPSRVHLLGQLGNGAVRELEMSYSMAQWLEEKPKDEYWHTEGL